MLYWQQQAKGGAAVQTILLLDEKNYDETLPQIRRTAVRGIIFRQDQLLLVRSSFGEVKLPGGGQERGEDDAATLIREVLEETGFQVQPDSIRPFGQVVERRLSRHEPMIWHQVNRYYFCTVDGEQQACQYSANEQRYGMRQVWLPLEEAIRVNRQMVLREGCNPWNQREVRVLEMLAAAASRGEDIGCRGTNA